MEWTDGILLNRTTQLRQWPLKLLEQRKKAEAKQHKVQWRGGGSKVRGEVNERLTIIYAILRQVYKLYSSKGTQSCKTQLTYNQSVGTVGYLASMLDSGPELLAWHIV